MKKEFSAGGIVFKQQNSNGQKKILWLLCQHSQHKGWVFPKGLIGDTKQDESKEETAIREVKEETGVKGKIIQELPKPVEYWYQFKEEKIFKTVYFFLMEEIGGDITKHDHEMMDVRWVLEEDVQKTLTFQNDKNAFEEALKILHNL